MEGHGRSWEVMEGHGRSFPITRFIFQVRKVMGGGGGCVTPSPQERERSREEGVLGELKRP